MSILIRNATILALGGAPGAEPFVGDLHIVGDRIAAMGRGLGVTAETVIDGTDRLVMPGLVNAHLHSGEALFKGRYDNLPLELWMLLSYPIIGASAVAERLIYLRSMLVGAESLRTGTTSLVDDVFEAPRQTMASLGAVIQAYLDVGIRATVSAHMVDRPFLDTIPFAREMVPADLQAEADRTPPPSVSDYMAFARAAYDRFHGLDGRIRFMAAPSAPQRCTAELMLAVDEFARATQTPFHTHIVETKVQGVTGPQMYGKTLIGYMADLGILHPGVTIAHSIWVTDDDIALMGRAGCSIVHNVISNQKLGAGIAPVRRMIDAGVNVALGSDGICSNDTPRMFDVVHAAGLIHKIATPDYDAWLTATEVLHTATVAGARSALTGHEVGHLAPGMKADLLVLDLTSAAFTPRNDLRNHLVYCENGSSITRVIVNGEIVVADGRCLRIDEPALLAELRALMPEFLARHAATETLNRRLMPSFAAIHRRCNAVDLGIHRLGMEPAWAGGWN